MYVDVLKAPTLLSLHSKSSIKEAGYCSWHPPTPQVQKKMAREDPLVWSTVKLVCERVKQEGKDKVYQGVFFIF